MSASLSSFNFDGHQIHYRPNTVDEDVLAHSFSNDIFYLRTPEYKGGKSSLAIDVGAHIGTFSIYSLLSGKAGKVIALEPNKENFEILRKNISENQLSDKITILQRALSDKDGRVRLYLDEENWGHSLTHTSLNKFEDVEACSLSALLADQHVECCDLIKFNCEGAEFRIVLSLDATTLKKIRMMIILFHEDMDSSGDRKELITFLTKRGFLIRLDNEDSRRGWIIAKNSSHYSRFRHELYVSSKEIKAKWQNLIRDLMNKLTSNKVWKFARKFKRNT